MKMWFTYDQDAGHFILMDAPVIAEAFVKIALDEDRLNSLSLNGLAEEKPSEPVELVMLAIDPVREESSQVWRPKNGRQIRAFREEWCENCTKFKWAEYMGNSVGDLCQIYMQLGTTSGFNPHVTHGTRTGRVECSKFERK